MVYKRLIEKYKSIRKQSYLSTLGRYQFKYAFIGVGHHSLTNLYPCLESLGVPLKFIYSRNLLNAERLARQYRDCSPTFKDASQVLTMLDERSEIAVLP